MKNAWDPPPARRARRKLPTRLHLPDCNTLAFARGDTEDTRKCDCGKPLGILPHDKTLVQRDSARRGRVALVVVAKSKVRDDEEDLAQSALLFETESDKWIREQQRADDRAERRAAKSAYAD